PAYSLHAIPNRAAPIKGAHNDRYLWPAFPRSEGDFLKRFSNHAQCRLRFSLTVGQSEVPIDGVLSPPEPFVRPGVDEYASAACRKCFADLPVQRSGLRVLPIAAAVQPNLCDEQRAIAGEIL